MGTTLLHTHTVFLWFVEMTAPRRGRACDACHSIKIKCELGASPSSVPPCERCLRLGKTCSVSAPIRKKDRIAELEAQLEEMTRLLRKQELQDERVGAEGRTSPRTPISLDARTRTPDSMEGTMCDLPGLLKLKKRYRFNLFVDEAHSIGALGPRGRGVCDYFNIDPAEVDILMGTLTKSFGANGGYVCAEKHIIDKLRSTNAATIYGESPTPPVLMQILSSLKIISGEISPGQGEERLQRIAFNSRYLRLGLKRLGFIVY